jgi:outer membrane lipoprotein-sorting protein
MESARRFIMIARAVLLVITAITGAPGQRTSEPPSVEDVLTRLDDLYRSKASIGRMEIVVTSPRHTRTLRLKSWTVGEDHALVVIESPAREAGIATLKVKDNLWNYLPKVARTIRIPPSMMLGSWMGTDFTNDDLVKESSYRKDFNSRIEGRSTEPPGWKLVLEAKPGTVGRWARIDLVVDDAILPVRMLHYDRKGRLARTLLFDEVKKLGGRVIPAHMTLEPKDTPGQRTEMRYLEMQFEATVPMDTFSLSRLEQKR